VSSHRGEYSEQIFTDNIFPKGFIRTGSCARITFGTNVKMYGKSDFFKFCKPHISSTSCPTQKIFYIQTLAGTPYRLTKFEDKLKKEYPSPQTP
jgi:hypothetical protein